MLVIDASYILSYLLDEKTPEEKSNLLTIIGQNALIAPELLKIEITNSLAMKLKRGLFDLNYCINALNIFETLNIEYFDLEMIGSLETILYFAKSQNLTAYDALYLKLAVEYKTNIASFDKKIIIAAHKLGIVCHS